MAKQTKALVAIFENPARGLVLTVEQMAGGTPHERVFMFCEVFDDCRMAVLAGKNYRMARNLFYSFLRTRIMTIFALKNSGVNSRFLYFLQQKQRFMRTMTFRTTDISTCNSEKSVMFDRVYLSESTRSGVKLAMAEKTVFEGIFFGHLRIFFRDRLNLAMIVLHMNITWTMTNLALDAEMDIFFMSIPDFIVTFAADLFALVHRLLTCDLRQTIAPVRTEFTETFRP
jgi:hypothetical protein